MNFNDANLFLNIFWLVPLLLIVLYYGSVVRNKKLSQFIRTEELKNQLTVNISQTKRRVRDVFFFFGILFLIIAAAGPHWGTKLVKRPGQSRDLLVVLDTSRSMLADDISPSRLMHAKWFVRNLLDQTPGDRYGLIAFSGTAFLECPLTQDRNGFLLFLNDINTDTIPVGGTNVEKALETALDAFKAAEGSNRAVIFITDGDELQGDSSKIIDDFKERNIPIFVVGIGDPNLGSFIQIEGNKFVLDKNGDRVKSKLNESSLQRIAAKVGGTYVHSTVVHDGLDHIVDKVRNLVPEQHEDNTVARPIERYQIPLFISFICFAIRLLIGERKQIIKPTTLTVDKTSAKKALAVFLIISFIACSTQFYVYAQDDEEPGESAFLDSPVLLSPSSDNASPNAQISKNQTSQMSRVSSEKDKMIHDSIESLLTRLEKASDPLEKAYLHYNLGVNYQLSGRSTQAETEYNNSLDLGNESKELKSVVCQNLGVLKHQETRETIAVAPDAAMESLAQAQGYYREAMRNNPNLKDIGINQELVLKDRKLIEEIKKLQQQMGDLQKDAQESTQDALDAQQEANQETDQALKDQKQEDAKNKTEKAQQATAKLEQAARQMGQENAAEYVKKAKEKLNQAGDEQSKSMQPLRKEDENEESSEKAGELISQALNQLGVKQEENDKESEDKKAQMGQEGEQDEKKNDDENNDQNDEMSQESQVAEKQSDSGNEGENDLRNLDQIQALSILNSMQEQERDLKQDLKDAEKQKMGTNDVKENW